MREFLLDPDLRAALVATIVMIVAGVVRALEKRKTARDARRSERRRINEEFELDIPDTGRFTIPPEFQPPSDDIEHARALTRGPDMDDEDTGRGRLP